MEPSPPTPTARAFWLTIMICIIVPFLLLSLIANAMRTHDFRDNMSLKMLGTSIRIYAGENRVEFPLLSSRAGHLMFEMKELYPEYIPNPNSMLSPADPLRNDPRRRVPEYYFENSSYYYLGYMVKSDEDILAFAEAYKERIASGYPFDAHLKANVPGGVIHRLREPRCVFGSMPDQIPVDDVPLLIEKPHPYPSAFGLYLFGPYIPLFKSTMAGCVVYRDCHMEFIEYPGKWPMTEKTIGALKELEAMRQP